MKINSDKLFSALWGLAEATVFFIVPDVLLSWYALDRIKRGLVACCYALAGALVGGALAWYWGVMSSESARDVFSLLPGINDALITRVQSQINDIGLLALLIGPLSGTPYKIYAAESAALGYGLGIFLLVSIPARLIRFVIVTVLVGLIARWLRNFMKPGTVKWIHLSGWAIFYAWYFYVMA